MTSSSHPHPPNQPLLLIAQAYNNIKSVHTRCPANSLRLIINGKKKNENVMQGIFQHLYNLLTITDG